MASLSISLFKPVGTRETGEPTHTAWNFTNPDESQPLQFAIEITGQAGGIVNPVLVLDQFAELNIPGTFQAGERVVVDGKQARIYDAKGKQRSSMSLKDVPRVSNGIHSLKFKTSYDSDENSPGVIILIRTIGAGEVVKLN